MAEALRLIGFKHSVYTWIVRLALHEMGLTADYVEANPFADPPDSVLSEYTPLRRVPVLQHRDFCLTETAAILRYLGALSHQRPLQPTEPKALAQMVQVIGLADADVYPSLVRHVFSAGFYVPAVTGAARNDHAVAEGIARAGPVLSLLEQIAGDGRQLNGHSVTLADLHLAPMISYFVRVPEGKAMLADYPALSAWWAGISTRNSLRMTDPFKHI